MAKSSGASLWQDISTRRFGFAATLFSYTYTMFEQGRAREAYDFLAERYPALLTPEVQPRNFKESLVRRAGLELMLGFAPREEAIAAMELWIQHWEAVTQDTYDEWEQRMWVHLGRGEIDQAAEIALADDLSRPIAENVRWKSRYEFDVVLRPLTEVPEVAARLRELDQELAQLQDDVRNMLLQLEWNE